jgi:hypothetical protein
MSQEKGNGLLCVWTDINPAVEEEFNAWYDEEHIPERILEVPGFMAARRYLCIDGAPKYLAVYELEDVSVLDTDAYKTVARRRSEGTDKLLPHFLNTVRNIYRKILDAGAPPEQEAQCLLSVRLGVAPEHDELFNAWYNEDHLPALAGVEGVHYARRFKATEGEPPYLALYEMDSPDVMETEAWEEARNYGRTEEVRPLFQDFNRDVYKPIFSMKK